MSDGSPRHPDITPPSTSPAAPDGGQARIPLADLVTVPVPSGYIEPPVDDRYHTFDYHLGQPVQVTCRMDGQERHGLQIQGHCTIVPAGTAHRWMFDRPAGAFLVRLSPAFVRETADAMNIKPQVGELAPRIQMRDAQIERIGWIMQAEDHEGCPTGRLFMDSLATALAARMIALQTRRDEPTPKSGRGLPPWRLRRVIEYIDVNLDRNLALAELADVAGFSLSHFKSLFKQAAGTPVHRFVLERRVERARMLLLKGEKSMTEIAMECGFAHSSHMARCIRSVSVRGV
jgi:AraC family transcriptional regulator